LGNEGGKFGRRQCDVSYLINIPNVCFDQAKVQILHTGIAQNIGALDKYFILKQGISGRPQSTNARLKLMLSQNEAPVHAVGWNSGDGRTENAFILQRKEINVDNLPTPNGPFLRFKKKGALLCPFGHVIENELVPQ
jgi:hypothetical protein